MRLIKRYGGGSRKLYDTRDSRYISLDEIPDRIRRGERLQVVDSRTGTDVTAQVLTQVIAEGHKRGAPFLSADFLHELIRRGEALVEASVGRLSPVREARDDIGLLRRGLSQLEHSLEAVEGRRPAARSQSQGGSL